MRRRKLCKCGCKASLARKRRGAIWASESCRKAFLRGEAPASPSKGRPYRRRRPSEAGLQVSFPKAVEAISDYAETSILKRGQRYPRAVKLIENACVAMGLEFEAEEPRPDEGGEL